MSDDEPRYTISERAFWWFRFWGAVIVVAGAGLAGVQWGLTRASKDDVAAVAKAVELKEDRVTAQAERAAIRGVVSNVRDNVIILMERQRLEPKPLPPALKDPMAKE